MEVTIAGTTFLKVENRLVNPAYIKTIKKEDEKIEITIANTKNGSSSGSGMLFEDEKIEITKESVLYERLKKFLH